MTDDDYNIIIEDILENKEFLKLQYMEHHGTTRLNHSKRVSYYSYRICKILHIDYISAARAGLLHDFFYNDNRKTKRQKIKSIFTHPKKSLENANNFFELNDIEQNIIMSHMFPLNIVLPQYLESWIVSIIDKIIGTYEFMEKISLKQIYVPNILVLLIKIFN